MPDGPKQGGRWRNGAEPVRCGGGPSQGPGHLGQQPQDASTARSRPPRSLRQLPQPSSSSACLGARGVMLPGLFPARSPVNPLNPPARGRDSPRRGRGSRSGSPSHSPLFATHLGGTSPLASRSARRAGGKVPRLTTPRSPAPPCGAPRAHWTCSSRRRPRPSRRSEPAASVPRPALEVQDIFRDHGPGFRRARAGRLSLGQLKVMSAIECCRTAALGGHVAACEDCGQNHIAYNSCRNRHSSQMPRPGRASNGWRNAMRPNCSPSPTTISSSPCHRRSPTSPIRTSR